VRALAELRALLLVAGEAGLADGAPREQPRDREFRHGIVAVAAAEAARLVDRSLPEDALAALVALHALRVLDLDGHAPAVRERDNRRLVGRVQKMLCSGSVASLAASRRELVARIQPEHFGVDRVRPVLLLELMARRAPRVADVAILVLGDSRCSERARNGEACEQ